jgi:PAS domain S-box-containing protein
MSRDSLYASKGLPMSRQRCFADGSHNVNFIRYGIIATVIWSLLIACSLLRDHLQHQKDAALLGKIQGLSFFEKDVLYRRWASRHGGVYVPVTESTQPNPFLSHIPERDISTPTGRRLTLMNPAYMTRQVYEMAQEYKGTGRGHINSLNPIRPENSPDPWEREALLSFERGTSEIGQIRHIDGKPYFRYMKSLMVEKPCLKCHQPQGYHEGDVRGGLSVSVAMEPIYVMMAQEMKGVYINHSIIWMLGLCMIGFGTRKLDRNAKSILEKSIELENEIDERMIAQEQLQEQAVQLEEEIAERQMAQDALQEQTNELLATDEMLRRQIEEYEISQEQRKNAEDELRLSVQLLNDAQRLANIGSWTLIAASNEMIWSQQLYEIFGYDPHIPPPLFIEHESFFTKESWELFSQAMEKAGRDGSPYAVDLDMIRTDGQMRQIRVKGSSVKDESGRVVRLYGTKQDVTERKQIEKVQLFLAEACSGATENEPFFNVLARYLARCLDMDFVCIDRLEGDNLTARTLAVWSDGQFEENTTYTLKDTPCGDVVGTDICCFPAEVCKRFPRDQALLALNAESYVGVTLWGRTNQPIGLIAVIGRKPLHNGALAETVLKMVSVRAASELERLEAEEVRIRLESQLQQSQKMEAVGRLAGGVAHDFNNMLTIILGHAQLALLEINPAQPLNEHLTLIQNAANRSADLTRQLLAFARKQTISPVVLNMNEAVSGMLKMLQRLIGEDIRLTWRPQADLWPVMIDPSQIDQILANLCVNARDAIADVGMIIIETGNSTFDAKYLSDHAGVEIGEYVWLSVNDDGCGITKETLSHIFEPFFTTKSPGAGTGLGLATVYGIVKQNNGFINVYSEPGMGSSFKIYIPRYQGKIGHLLADSSEVPLPGGHETILVVEDESDILRMTKDILEKQGYTVMAANSPNEAIIMAGEAGEIHLLITDVIMPEMNGFDLSRNLLQRHPSMKCLFMSGYTADVIASHGALDKNIQFIQKPFSVSGLAFKVRDVLDCV